MPSFLVGIWIGTGKPFSLALRTARALRKLGTPTECIYWVPTHRSHSPTDARFAGSISILELFDLARHRRRSLWLLDAGSWPIHPIPHSILEAIASHRLIAFGAVKRDKYGLAPNDAVPCIWDRSQGNRYPNAEADDWIPDATDGWSSLFIPQSMLDAVSADPGESDFRNHLRGSILHASEDRIAGVRIDGLDVRNDQRLRIAQVITSLQRGGAERIALDLHYYWLQQGVHAALCTIDSPRREAFPNPPCFVHYFDRNHRDLRVDACAQFMSRFQPDVVHTHLLSRKEQQAFASLGIPSMATLHNMQQGWPRDWEQTLEDEVQLMVSCAKAVEHQATKGLPHLDHRTVWNGISGRRFQTDPESHASRRSRMRERYGIASDDWVLLALANPRPQKRLERLPRIVSHLQQRVAPSAGKRRVHAIFAGEASVINVHSQESSRLLDAAIQASSLHEVCHRVGSIEKVEEILAAADVLVSCSEYEGLSLAHLESLAAGLPVVATDVGGNREIAASIPAMHLVDASCDDQEFAGAVHKVLEARHQGCGEGSERLHRSFETYTMGRSYHRMVQGLIGKTSRSAPNGLWLITNNFSVGGAQSSARRLLEKLHQRGRSVQAAVLEEDPANPTPGTQALRSKGISVFSVPKPAMGHEYSTAVQSAVGLLLDAIDRQPPEALVFWNTIPAYKLLLADGLIGVPIFDVSPGEMNLESLETCLATGIAGLPYQSTLDYGGRLKGAVVKYGAELPVAKKAFGVHCPVVVIPNGVPVAKEKAPVAPAGPIRIGTSTRLNPHKRVEDLLDALRHLAPTQLANLELRIAGGVDGDWESYAEQLLHEAVGLPVRWLGNVTDIDAFLREQDLFVMISEPAGCPNAILEAMSVGLPVIATDVGGAAEMVIHRECGIIVPPRSAHAMAAAIEELLSSAEKRTRYGKAAHLRANAYYSVDRMADDYERFFFGAPANSPKDSGR